jgi:hypothetical protein
MFAQVIFAIDNDDDIHAVAKFLRHVDTLQAMTKVGVVTQLIGCYKGKLEKSYMIREDQFKYVRRFTERQESVLLVPGDVRQPCVLEYADGDMVGIGPMRQVSAVEALQADAWTYNPKVDKYFVCG